MQGRAPIVRWVPSTGGGGAHRGSTNLGKGPTCKRGDIYFLGCGPTWQSTAVATLQERVPRAGEGTHCAVGPIHRLSGLRSHMAVPQAKRR